MGFSFYGFVDRIGELAHITQHNTIKYNVYIQFFPPCSIRFDFHFADFAIHFITEWIVICVFVCVEIFIILQYEILLCLVCLDWHLFVHVSYTQFCIHNIYRLNARDSKIDIEIKTTENEEERWKVEIIHWTTTG